MAITQIKQNLAKTLHKKNSYLARSRLNRFLSVSGLNSFPSKTDSARSIMNHHAQQQCVNMLHSQKPYINTNFEDMLGNASVYRVTADHDFVVLRIIRKYAENNSDIQRYLMFVQYLESGIVDVLERKDVENLSEKYGFQYINDGFDKLREGDIIKKGTVLAHSTAYDQFDNYGAGQNVLFMYQSDAYTMEDSISITESFSKYFSSMEVESINIKQNENNAMINAYGDDDNYKTWPDVGEQIKDKLLCARRILNRHELYYAFKSSNLRKKLRTDKAFISEGTVVDLDIYCNKPRAEIPNTPYNKQFLHYLDMLTKFRTEVFEYTGELRKGYKCSRKILELNKRCGELINPNTRIKDDAKEFSFAELSFTVKREVGVSIGQKITGRNGNKGVVSRIIPDHLGYHLRNGKVIQMLLNPLGVANRLNIMQLFEQSITYRAQRIIERMRTVTTLKEKEQLVFPFIRIFNEAEADALEQNYKKLSTKEKRGFMQDTEEYGIFITVNPFWHDKELFDCVMECEEKFPWIEPYEIFFYNETSKRWVRQINKQPIGYMYMVKMKQTSKRGMSARATGPINQRGVPDKSHDARDHVSLIANGAVRLGIQEYSNYVISVDARYVAAESMMYRSSSVARRKLAKMQELAPLGVVPTFGFDDTMTNQNVETFNAKMLAMGLVLRFEEDRLDFSDKPGIKHHVYKNEQYYCTTNEMRKILARDIVENEINCNGICILGTDADKETFVEQVSYQIASSVEFMV